MNEQNEAFTPAGETHPQLLSRRVKATSKGVFSEMIFEGKLGLERRKVHDLLLLQGPLTGREIDERLGNVSGHKRLSELRKLGKAAVCGRRTCSISGKMVEEWTVPDKMPGRPSVAPLIVPPAEPKVQGKPTQGEMF